MKALFVAVNAKYIHSNLAVRYLARYCGDIADCRIVEFTINGFVSDVLREIFSGGCRRRLLFLLSLEHKFHFRGG